MKTRIAILLTIGMFVVYSCSKKDKDDSSTPPTAVGYTAKVDGKAYVGERGRKKIDSPIVLIKLGKHMKLISNMGTDKGMIVGIELINNKLEPGTYSFSPRANGTLAAMLFYSEDVDKPTSINYASYYVSKAVQGDGQVTITTVTDSSIIGSFHGKALTAFGQVADTLKDITEGKIYIKF